MSKYYVNKFLFTVDRDPDHLDAYAKDPKEFVKHWEQEVGPKLNDIDRTTVNALSDEERGALINHDYVALFEMGAHFFLNLTLFIAIFDESWALEKGPLSFQREFGTQLQHWLGRPYPSVAT
jgi:hypothetical protein